MKEIISGGNVKVPGFQEIPQEATCVYAKKTGRQTEGRPEKKEVPGNQGKQSSGSMGSSCQRISK